MFEKRITVTDEFLDDLNHVNYLNYIRLLGEVTFDEYRHAIHIDLATLQSEFGVALVVAEIGAKYFLPLKHGDVAIVQLTPTQIEGNRLYNAATIKKRGRSMAQISMVMMAVDFATGKPCELPQAVIERIHSKALAA